MAKYLCRFDCIGPRQLDGDTCFGELAVNHIFKVIAAGVLKEQQLLCHKVCIFWNGIVRFIVLMQCTVGLFDDCCQRHHFSNVCIGIDILLKTRAHFVEFFKPDRVTPSVLFACVHHRFDSDGTVHVLVDHLGRDTVGVVRLEPVERIV